MGTRMTESTLESIRRDLNAITGSEIARGEYGQYEAGSLAEYARGLLAEVEALRADLAEARASAITPEQAERLDFADEFNELAGGGR